MCVHCSPKSKRCIAKSVSKTCLKPWHCLCEHFNILIIRKTLSKLGFVDHETGFSDFCSEILKVRIFYGNKDALKTKMDTKRDSFEFKYAMTVKGGLSYLKSCSGELLPSPPHLLPPPPTTGSCQAGLNAGQLMLQQVAQQKRNSIRSRCQVSGLARQWRIQHLHAVNTFVLRWKRQERIFRQK